MVAGLFHGVCRCLGTAAARWAPVRAANAAFVYWSPQASYKDV